MHDDENQKKGTMTMKRRLFAYALVFAVSATAGYAITRPATAATTVSVSLHAQPVHYAYRPPVRYYGPVPRYYPRGYFAPHYYYGPRDPASYWTYRNSWDRHDRRNWNDHRDRRDHDRHDRHDNDHRGHDGDHHRDRDGHWGR